MVLVVALVGAVLDVGEDGGAEGAALIGEVDPLVGGDFELALEFAVGRSMVPMSQL